MKNRIEIYPSKEHKQKAYELYCEKRFRALMLERIGDCIYQGDDLVSEIFTQELRTQGVLFLPLVINGRKIAL